MSYCQPNSHARQTILRGCCTGSTPTCCNTPSSYDARKYCECNDGRGDNISPTDKEGLCLILTANFHGQTLDSDEVYALLNSINFTNICGPWLLTIVPTSGSLINIGTVENGRITVTNNTVVDNEYTVIINATPISECGTFTALN